MKFFKRRPIWHYTERIYFFKNFIGNLNYPIWSEIGFQIWLNLLINSEDRGVGQNYIHPFDFIHA